MDTTCLGGGRRKKQQQQQQTIEKEIFKQSKNETLKQQELKESEQQYQNYPLQYRRPCYRIETTQNWNLPPHRKNTTDNYYPEHCYDNETHFCHQKPYHHYHHHHYHEQEEQQHYYQNQFQVHPCCHIDFKDIIEKKGNSKQKKPLKYSMDPQIIMHPLSPGRNSPHSGTNSNNDNSSSNNSTNSSIKSLQLNQNLLQQQEQHLSPQHKNSPEISSASVLTGAVNKKPVGSTNTPIHSPTIAPTCNIPFATPSSNVAVSIASSSLSTELDFTKNATTCCRGDNENFELLDRTIPTSSDFLISKSQINSNNSNHSNKKETKIQQQQRYPILDLDAIEICNEQDSVTQKPLHLAQQMSLIKSLRGKKSQQPPLSSNMRNVNYNLMGTNESGSSGHSSNSGFGYNTATLEANVKWSHNLPTTSTGVALHRDPFFCNNEIIDDIPLHHPHPFHHDYSYAYYEPGAAMRHSNIPTPEQQDVSESPNRLPPPNSIRALLSKGKKNKILVSPAVRQSYQAKLAASLQENFYEEIESESKGGSSQKGNQSMGALNISMVKEEFRRVQSNHRKILGELNLSVEAMLMPKTPPSISPTGKETSPIQHLSDISNSSSSQSLNKKSNSKSKAPKSNKSADNIDEILNAPIPQPSNLISSVSSSISNTISFCVASNTCSIGRPITPTEEICNVTASNISSSTCAANTDLDSGFSGSSGASYIGSLRYHKTNVALSNIISSKKLTSTTNKTGRDQILKEDVQEIQNSNEKSNQNFSVSFSENNFNTITEQLTKSNRSSQRSNQSILRNVKGNNELTSGNNNKSNNSSSTNPFIIQSSHGKKVLNFSKLNSMEQINSSKVATPTESKARSFWAKKGWKKNQASTSTSTSEQEEKEKLTSSKKCYVTLGYTEKETQTTDD